MITVTLTVDKESVRRWGAAVDELMFRLADANWQATRDGLHTIESAEKTLLSLRPHPPRTPSPASPGSPPGLISGHLMRSVRVDGPWQLSLSKVEGSVGPTAVYARIHELSGWSGPGHRTFLPARPYHRPTVDALIPQIRQRYADLWARAILDAQQASRG